MSFEEGEIEEGEVAEEGEVRYKFCQNLPTQIAAFLTKKRGF